MIKEQNSIPAQKDKRQFTARDVVNEIFPGVVWTTETDASCYFPWLYDGPVYAEIHFDHDLDVRSKHANGRREKLIIPCSVLDKVAKGASGEKVKW